MTNEPVALSAAITAAVTALVAIFTGYMVATDYMAVALAAVITSTTAVIVGLVTALAARAKVTPVANPTLPNRQNKR